MTLKIGISGIRGIIGRSLNDEIASDFAKAFATYINAGTVVIGRDTRSSGEALNKLFIDNLTKLGINIIDAGIVPTPTVQVLVKTLNAQGGIVVTASHNPSEWNGFKFISSKSMFLNQGENDKLIGIYESKSFKKEEQPGNASKPEGLNRHHIDLIIKNINIDKVKEKKFKVAIDSCNGAGSIITQELLKELGCEVIPLNTDMKKDFPRGTEPTPENLTELCKLVKETGADIGFAQDPDADRLSIVSNEGIAIGEEYTLALSALYLLSSQKWDTPPTIATNLSTSMMIDDVAKKFGAPVVRTKVGEINVVEEISKLKNSFGGEGNGGIIYPKVISSRDSLTGIAIILSLMAAQNKNISDIANEIPKYKMIKSKINCSSTEAANALTKKVASKFKNEKIDSVDGIKVIFEDSWLHVRASNTEPVVRVIAEAKNEEDTETLINSIKAS